MEEVLRRRRLSQAFYVLPPSDEELRRRAGIIILPILIFIINQKTRDQALTGSDFQLRVGLGSELKSRVVGYPRVG